MIAIPSEYSGGALSNIIKNANESEDATGDFDETTDAPDESAPATIENEPEFIGNESLSLVDDDDFEEDE